MPKNKQAAKGKGHSKKIARELNRLLPDELIGRVRNLGDTDEEWDIMRESGFKLKYLVFVVNQKTEQARSFMLENDKGIPTVMRKVKEFFPKEMACQADDVSDIERAHEAMTENCDMWKDGIEKALGARGLTCTVKPMALDDMKRSVHKGNMPVPHYVVRVNKPEEEGHNYQIGGMKNIYWLLEQIQRDFPEEMKVED